jgi:hypothetical protein
VARNGADAACQAAFPNLRDEFREVFVRLESASVRVTARIQPRSHLSAALDRKELEGGLRGVLVAPAGTSDPPPQARPLSPMTRQFLEDVRWRLPDNASDVRWIPKDHGTLWARFDIGSEAYWFIESGLQPEGDFPSTSMGLMGGLGLAIVERIVRAHGGCLALLPREGGGLEARVDLPLG